MVCSEVWVMKRVLVRGPALSSSGYGEQTRFALRALKEHGERFEIFLQNIKWGNTGWILPEHPEREWLDELIGKTQIYAQQGGQFDISLQVTIPNEFERLAPVNIGYTAGIETTKIAPQWVEKCRMMEKLIVVSNHAKFGFDNTVYNAKNQDTGEEFEFRNQTPVEVVNYAVKAFDSLPKLDLGLETDFNFLTVAQWGPRKNVETTILGFLEEFKDEEDVGLVMKMSIAKSNVRDRVECEKRVDSLLKGFGEHKCKVYLVHGNMSDEEMHSLYVNPKIKAIVSTSHGEGFGLPLFEAAYSGLPVICPNWSGQTDFLYAPVRDKKTKKVRKKPHFLKIEYDMGNVQQQAVWNGVIQADSMWCFPRKSSLRDRMREMYKNPGPAVSKAKNLKNFLTEEFSPAIKYREFADAVYIPVEGEEQWQESIGEISEV